MIKHGPLSALCLLLILLVPVIGTAGESTPSPGPPYVLERGLVADRGLPLSSLDLSDYLWGMYRGAAGESIYVYFADPVAVQRIIDRQGSWEVFNCSSGSYRRAVRFGVDYLVLVTDMAVIAGFPLQTDNHCEFLQLLASGMRMLESNPEYMFDPFPARLPFNQQ
ncbi:hypothetical protein [Spirochaeta dissipatitropha]